MMRMSLYPPIFYFVLFCVFISNPISNPISNLISNLISNPNPNLISNPISNPIPNPILNPISNLISNPISVLFRFWQSYFIKLFGGGLQCKFIQTFSTYIGKNNQGPSLNNVDQRSHIMQCTYKSKINFDKFLLVMLQILFWKTERSNYHQLS